MTRTVRDVIHIKSDVYENDRKREKNTKRKKKLKEPLDILHLFILQLLANSVVFFLLLPSLSISFYAEFYCFVVFGMIFLKCLFLCNIVLNFSLKSHRLFVFVNALHPELDPK